LFFACPSASIVPQSVEFDGICCCGSQDMLMVVDLVIIACGYAELILGERWPPSKGEL